MDFLVKRDIVARQSVFFSRCIASAEPESRSVTLPSTRLSIISVELLLRVFHQTLNAQMFDYENVNVKELWHIIDACDICKISPNLLQSWFKRYYQVAIVARQRMYLTLARHLLVPSYTFKHVQGFADATKFLVYHERDWPGIEKPSHHFNIKISREVKSMYIQNSLFGFLLTCYRCNNSCTGRC